MTIGGRNTQRVVPGALTTATGEPVRVARERSRTDDVVAAVEALGAVRPGVPKLPVWDNAPPHHPQRVKTAAAAAGIAPAFLPFRAPEPMPRADLWRHLKATVRARRSATPERPRLAER